MTVEVIRYSVTVVDQDNIYSLINYKVARWCKEGNWSFLQVRAYKSGSWCFHPVGAGKSRGFMLLLVGAGKMNVILYNIRKSFRGFLPFWVST